MTPTRSRWLTTGRWRMRFPVIMAAHSSTDVSVAQAVTGVVMTSATLVTAGSRRGATTRRRISRSVKMPPSRPPSVTTRPPIPRSLMSSAALSTVSPGFTEMTSLPFLARISWTVGTLPPPAGGFRDTTALTAGAPPYPVPAMHIEEGAPSRRCRHGAASYRRRPRGCTCPPGRRRACHRRRPHGARRILPGAGLSDLDRVRRDDVRRDSVRDGWLQGRDRGLRLPLVDPLGARRLAADRAQGLLGPDRRSRRRDRFVPDRPHAAVPDQRTARGEYGDRVGLSQSRRMPRAAPVRRSTSRADPARAVSGARPDC